MRPHGQTKLGFFPLPVAEAKRLKNWLTFPERFSALDPCVGDGAAFAGLLHGATAHRYGIEIDANRAEQARALGIETLQANAMDVRCPQEAVSLLYLNPPYDWESGESNNQRLELVFLEHSYRWVKAGGVLVFVIPQLRLAKCARLLSEHFADLRVFRLTEPACLEYKQIVVLELAANDTPGLRTRFCWKECATSKCWQRRVSLSLWATLLMSVTKFPPRSRLS